MMMMIIIIIILIALIVSIVREWFLNIITSQRIFHNRSASIHQAVYCLEVRQKYSAARRIFNSLLGVSSGDETLRLMFDLLHENLDLQKDVLR